MKFLFKKRQCSIDNSQWAMGNGQLKSMYVAICLLFIVYCLLFVVSACNDKKNPHAEHAAEAAEEVWTCPMHPEIIKDKPGQCPICGMDLVKKESGGAKLSDADLESLLKPTNEFVVSSIPVTTIKKKKETIEIEALGNTTYDTREIRSISAKVSGRIEKLYVRYRYQHVHKGEKIMDIYSPELLTAQQNLLFLIKNDPENHSLIESAKQKLLLLGMDNGQLNKVINTQKPLLSVAVYSNYTGHLHEAGSMEMNLNNDEGKMDISRITEELAIKEGMYVQKGQTVFQLYNTDRSWVVLNIFPESQNLIKVGNAVRIVPETAPGKNFRATISFIEPFYRKESKTITVRIYFDNSSLNIPIGSQVKATIFGNTTDADWLPEDAVVSLGMDKIVFKKEGGGFKAHKITTGITTKNNIQVLGGITETDSVAVNAQYLMDSESFIKVKN